MSDSLDCPDIRAHVVLDLPTSACFDYAIPEGVHPEDLAGQRVLVPWGRGKAIGVVWGTGPSALPAERIKPIIAVLDELPAFDAHWCAFVSFAAGYYQRGLGETALQTLPVALRSAAAYKLSSVSKRKVAVAPSEPRWRCVAVHRAVQASEVRAAGKDAAKASANGT
ncbi:MAG TPA: hypothetical protein VFS42_11480, partial [Burkholderiaceae bacterium]|nr:hypothetical protein [Burkholderiaceae bacterium]